MESGEEIIAVNEDGHAAITRIAEITNDAVIGTCYRME